MTSVKWAPAAYLRLLRTAHAQRAEISELLDSRIALHRVEALYSFAAQDFGKAFLSFALSSDEATLPSPLF